MGEKIKTEEGGGTGAMRVTAWQLLTVPRAPSTNVLSGLGLILKRQIGLPNVLYTQNAKGPGNFWLLVHCLSIIFHYGIKINGKGCALGNVRPWQVMSGFNGQFHASLGNGETLSKP